jgi:hypothetical protein
MAGCQHRLIKLTYGNLIKKIATSAISITSSIAIYDFSPSTTDKKYSGHLPAYSVLQTGLRIL